MARISTRAVLSPLGSLTGPALGLGFVYMTARARIAKGESPFSAYMKEAFVQAPWFLMSTPAALAITMLPVFPALTQAGLAVWDARSSYLRSAQTPFSQRYEHSEAAAASMKNNLQAITQSRGVLGTEAFNLSKRYSR